MTGTTTPMLRTLCRTFIEIPRTLLESRHSVVKITSREVTVTILVPAAKKAGTMPCTATKISVVKVPYVSIRRHDVPVVSDNLLTPWVLQ